MIPSQLPPCRNTSATHTLKGYTMARGGHLPRLYRDLAHNPSSQVADKLSRPDAGKGYSVTRAPGPGTWKYISSQIGLPQGINPSCYRHPANGMVAQTNPSLNPDHKDVASAREPVTAYRANGFLTPTLAVLQKQPRLPLLARSCVVSLARLPGYCTQCPLACFLSGSRHHLAVILP